MSFPVHKMDLLLRYSRPVFWGCAAAAMISLAGCGLVGYAFWSAVLD